MSYNFIPDDYKPPKSESGYTRFEEGETKVRILSKPIIGWEDWKEKRPYRFKMDNKPEKPMEKGKIIRHFWAFIVWNYKNEKLQICEIAQAMIRTAILNLSKDNDWGNPLDYDIKIVRTGKDKETRYNVIPMPKKEISEEIKAIFESTPINLSALFEGQDPFQQIQ